MFTPGQVVGTNGALAPRPVVHEALSHGVLLDAPSVGPAF